MQVQTAAPHYRNIRTIDPQQALQIRYWAREFDVPPSKLLQVMREVGRNVSEIRRRFEH